MMLGIGVFAVLIASFPGTTSFTFPRPGSKNQVYLKAASDATHSAVKSRMLCITSSKTISISRDISVETGAHSDAEAFLLSRDKPPLLYLPGFDGIENYSSNSISKLNSAFDVWKMAISEDDRSSFMEIATIVLKTLENFDRPVTLVGESFGGLLGTYIALRAKKGLISKLVLINPATSFDRTAWPILAPLIANSGTALPVVGLATLLTTMTDPSQIRRLGQRALRGITSTETAISALNDIFKNGKLFTEQLSADTINWRVTKWFCLGASLMEGKYSLIKIPTLILIGKNDRLLPSRSEGQRLLKQMTSCEQVELKEFDIGHTLLEEGFLDIGDEILQTAVFGSPKNPLDIPFPTEADMEEVERNFGPFLNAMSPIFLTRGKDGRLQRGVDSIPTGIEGRPVLFVGNHQLYGTDCAQIIREFILQKNTLVRGLAHPLVFNDKDSNPLMAKTLKQFGAVEVSPAHIFEVTILP